MTPRRILIVAVLAIVAITSAVLVANLRTESKQTSGALLYPQLRAQADSVKAIRIFKAGDARALEIVRNGDQWTLTERNGHPIAAVKARNLVRALTSAKVLEEKTADETKYTALAVEDIKNAEAKGLRIELEGPADPVNLIVGKDGPGGKSSYVRRVGETQSWLVSEQLSASTEVRDWLDKDIVNVSADRIQSAAIAISGQKPYTASKASRADADFKVEPLAKGQTLNSDGAANAVATALLSLTLDDVLPKSELTGDKPAAQATYKTFDGLVIDLQGFKKNDKHYLTVASSFDQPLADRFAVKTTEQKPADEEAQKNAAASNETASKPSADAAADAKSIAEKTAQWAYEIPPYKYDAIFRPLQELLKQ